MHPSVATHWRVRNRMIAWQGLPRIMGILNVTPDSFSDGGRHDNVQRATEHGRRLADQGADILDIGGESTRPYSTPVTVDEELRRVIPVIHALAKQLTIPISIDTSKARVAREAVAAGAEIINDVTGLTGDSEMVAAALETGAGICAMHMQGTPQTMQDNPSYTEVLAEIADYLQRRRDALLAVGIDQDRICLDPGIGFGKSHAQNLTLVANCHRFHSLGCPLLVGHSRKGFIGKIIGDPERDRTAGTIGVSLALARQQVQILRVHDVQATRDALLLFAACGGLP